MTVKPKPTSIDCLIYWLIFKIRMGSPPLKYISSHEIQSTLFGSPIVWIKKNHELMFNPETMSRAWRHARDQGRVKVKEVSEKGPENHWEVIEIDGRSWKTVRHSEFPQGELFD